MGTLRSTEQGPSASFSWSLGQYDSPPGLGLHEPVALPMALRTGALSCLTHRPAAADPGYTEIQAGSSTELKAPCNSLSPPRGLLSPVGSQKWASVLLENCQARQFREMASFARYSGSSDKTIKPAFLSATLSALSSVLCRSAPFPHKKYSFRKRR